jgi:PAS domain S-box-containing protein
MSLYLVLIIIAVLLLIPIGTRIYFLDPKNPLHRSTALSSFLIGVVGVIEYQIGHTTTVEEVAHLALFHSSSALILIYVTSLGAYYYVAPHSESWKKWGFYSIIALAIPPLIVIYNLFFEGAILDTNHQFIDEKWQYTVLQDGFIPTIYGSSFLLLQLYLSISHFIAYRKSKYKREKLWRLLLLIVFTTIPGYLIYTFIYGVNDQELGDYGMTPFLAIVIFVISWIYTNFKLFEISPIVAIDNILDSMSNIIIITDNDFNIKYVNKALEKIGIKRKDATGKSLIRAAQKFGNLGPERFELIRQLKQTEKRERTIMFDINNRIYHLLMTVLATYNQQNIRIGYVFALIDLTETVETRNQLTNYTQQLEQSNKELESFAYIASHDMKTPLRNIVSFLNLLERKLKNHDDKDIHEFIEFASSNARYMHSLVQDILEFSKISKTEQSFVDVDLQEVVLSIISHFPDYIQDKNASIEFGILPVITANKIQVHQLFQNLIENGIKYNESDTPSVNIQILETENSLQVTFEDNGIGISEKFHKQIFDIFKRLHNDTTYQGTGIGLAICKKIMDLHNGDIYVESNDGIGSRFVVEFPKESSKN